MVDTKTGAPTCFSSMSPAQNDRMEYIFRTLGGLCKYAIPVQVDKLGKETASHDTLKAIVDAYDVSALENLASRESARRTDGPKVADKMTEKTGTPWRWDGLRVVTCLPVYDEADVTDLNHKLNALQQDKAIKWRVSGEGRPIRHSYVSLTDFNL